MKNFLSSKEWKILRQEALSRDNKLCFLCNCKNDLVVHHILYRKFYKEYLDLPWNCVTVCKSCHWKIHRSSLGILLYHKLEMTRPYQYMMILKHMINNHQKI